MLKRKKSTDLDEIPPWLLKDSSSLLSKPTAHIINISLNTSVYPTDWKRTKIIPLYNAGQHNKLDNYRPISVIPAVSKIIEKIVHQQLFDYLEDNNLLEDDQYGFRCCRSTEMATTLFIDKIKYKVNNGKMVGAVFLDLSKAFDTLNHGKILDKLESYGVRDAELEWFGNYLFGRSQRVSYNDCLSDEMFVLNGVSQGSILRPLLYIVFFNDLASCLKHTESIKYADDTVIYVAGKDLFIIESRISSDMQRLSDWCKENELFLNLSKGKI